MGCYNYYRGWSSWFGLDIELFLKRINNKFLAIERFEKKGKKNLGICKP